MSRLRICHPFFQREILINHQNETTLELMRKILTNSAIQKQTIQITYRTNTESPLNFLHYNTLLSLRHSTDN